MLLTATLGQTNETMESFSQQQRFKILVGNKSQQPQNNWCRASYLGPFWSHSYIVKLAWNLIFTLLEKKTWCLRQYFDPLCNTVWSASARFWFYTKHHVQLSINLWGVLTGYKLHQAFAQRICAGNSDKAIDTTTHLG